MFVPGFLQCGHRNLDDWRATGHPTRSFKYRFAARAFSLPGHQFHVLNNFSITHVLRTCASQLLRTFFFLPGIPILNEYHIWISPLVFQIILIYQIVFFKSKIDRIEILYLCSSYILFFLETFNLHVIIIIISICK